MSETYHILLPRPYPGLLSIVIPLYNEEEVVPLLANRLTSVCEKLQGNVEIVLVNDGSSDATLARLMEIASKDARFKVIALARNFGQQFAATAGLDYAKGDAIVLMDADLQDPPEVILEMIEKYCAGYDVVYGRRTDREGETIFKRLTAWLFYRLMRALVHKDLPVDVGDFRLVSRRCLDALKQMQEAHRFLRGMVTWVGFPQTMVDFKRARRAASSTKYTLPKMLLFAWTAAVSFSPLPLRVSFAMGVLLFSLGGSYGVYALVRMLLGLYVIPGWTSVIVLNCIVGGAVMVGIGILGEYVGRIFEQSKARPLYVVAYTANVDSSAMDLSTQFSLQPPRAEVNGEGPYGM